MSEDTYPIKDRTHTTKDGVKLFLVPDKMCEGCIATKTGNRNDKVCHSLPPCGDNDAWVDEDTFAQWVAEVRLE